MRALMTMAAMTAVLAAIPASALDRYRCSDASSGLGLMLEIDQAANTMKYGDDKTPMRSVCLLLTSGMDDAAALAGQCHVRVAGDLAMVDLPLRSDSRDQTSIAAFDRRDLSFVILGRGPTDNLKIAMTCKRG